MITTASVGSEKIAFRAVGDLEACEVVAGLYPKLHRPAPAQLRTVTSYVEEWAAALAGTLVAPSSYFMKSPPIQIHDDIAHNRVEDFIRGEDNETLVGTEKPETRRLRKLAGSPAKSTAKVATAAGDIATNRKASHRYEFIEKFEAGIVVNPITLGPDATLRALLDTAAGLVTILLCTCSILSRLCDPRVILFDLFARLLLLFSDDPFFVLDAPWVEADQKAAARLFETLGGLSFVTAAKAFSEVVLILAQINVVPIVTVGRVEISV